MAIADFFHCENISDVVVETPRFKRMVHVLSKIGSDFEIPKRRQIGGPLLDLNFQTKYNDNKTNLLKDKKTFIILRRMTMILKNFLPFNIFGIAPILKKIPPLDGSVFGAVMCLSLSMLHVPSIM